MEQYFFLVLFNIIVFILLYKFSRSFNLTDKPNLRKIHSEPIPLIGGLIIYFSIIFSMYLFEYPEQINLIIVYSGIIVLSGFLDDFSELKVQTRIILIFLASYFLISEGLILTKIIISDQLTINLGAFGLIFTVLCVAGLTNAFNFLDGLDGLLISQVILSYGFLLIYTYLFINDFFILNFFITIFILCFFGILYNFGIFKNLKIFLGDSGSTFFGFSFGFLLIFFSNQGNLIQSDVLIIWTVAYPIMDFTSTVIRRIMNKKNPFQPDMTHFHHLLHKYNVNKYTILTIISLISLSLGVLGYITTVYLNSLISLIIFIFITLFFTFFSIMFNNYLKKSTK